MEQKPTDIPFHSLPIAEPVLKGIEAADFKICTPIQSQTLPISLSGKDVAGQAQTGTGKTAAFLISMFSRLVKNKKYKGKNADWVAPRALIIAPTRELARQIEKDAIVLGKFCDLRIVCIHGGMDYHKQRNQIKQGVDVLIVTPGRLIDYYKQKFFSLKSVEVLVIDEADRLFDMGFIKDLRFILRNLSPYHRRLSMLFSATLTFQVMELCYEHMNNAEKVAIEPEKIVVDEVEQSIYHVGTHEKINLLLGILKQENGEKVIVFCNTKKTSEELERWLQANEYKAGQISGDLNQRARLRVLDHFAKGELQVLIATDVASRGLHIPDVSHVINYELPQDPEDYIHRIGRTARAGAQGTAISLGCEDYVENLERIEEVIKIQIPVVWAEEEMYLKAKDPLPAKKRSPRPRPKRNDISRSRSGRPSSNRRPPQRNRGSSNRSPSNRPS